MRPPSSSPHHHLLAPTPLPHLPPQGYQAVLEFPVACGVTVGTPVRIRGVPVGSVLSVQPSLEKVDVLVEMRDTATVIPRNSTIEANQSGLIAEPLIDITPQAPVPRYKGAAGGSGTRGRRVGCGAGYGVWGVGWERQERI